MINFPNIKYTITTDTHNTEKSQNRSIHNIFCIFLVDFSRNHLLLLPFYRHIPTTEEMEMAENRGNFANDRERASQAGQKGGQSAQGGMGNRQSSQSSGKTGQQTGGQHSGGNFANDPQRASEAGRKGGDHSGGGNR